MGIKFLSFPVYLLKARENEPTCSASSNMLDKKFWIRLRTMLDDFGPKMLGKSLNLFKHSSNISLAFFSC